MLPGRLPQFAPQVDLAAGGSVAGRELPVT